MLKVRDIMTTDVISVTSDMTLRDAIELFAKRHVSGAPVRDGTEVLGVVSASDILAFEASTAGAQPERDEVEWSDLDEEETPESDDGDDEPASEFFTGEWADADTEVEERVSGLRPPQWDLLEEHTVEEVMTRRLVAVSPNASVEEAARLMKLSGIHRVFVTEDKQVVGVVSAIDIAYAVAEHQIGKRTYVFNRGQDFPNRER